MICYLVIIAYRLFIGNKKIDCTTPIGLLFMFTNKISQLDSNHFEMSTQLKVECQSCAIISSIFINIHLPLNSQYHQTHYKCLGNNSRTPVRTNKFTTRNPTPMRTISTIS